MSIAFGAIGTMSAGGTTTINIPHPASVGAGNLLIAGRCIWNSTGTATNESGWTPGGELTGGTGSAADSHTTRIRADYKVAAGGETGNVTFDQAGTLSGAVGQMARYTCAGTWDVASATGTDDTHGANRSITTSTSIQMQAGDWLVAIVAQDTDTSQTITSPTFSATGMTFGTATRRTSGAGVGTGNDGNIDIFDVPITAGSGTQTVTFSLTSATSQCGPVVILRLREILPSLSDPIGHIAFSSDTAASSHTTASFTPRADSKIWVWHFAHAPSGAGTTAISDSGGRTWTEHITSAQSSSRCYLWSAPAGASPGSMTITFTGSTSHYRGYGIWDIDASLDILSGQLAASVLENGTPTVTGTLPSATTSGNRVFACFTQNDDNQSGVPTPSGFASLIAAGGGSTYFATRISHRNDFAGTSTSVVQDETSLPSGGAIFELGASGPPAINASPSAIASSETFGGANATIQIPAGPSGVSTGVAFGTPAAVGVLSVNPTGFADPDGFGSPNISAVYTAFPSAIASALVFGSLVTGGVVGLVPTGIVSAESVGLPLVSPVVTVSPNSIADGSAVGSPSVLTGLTLLPSGVPSALAFGSPLVNTVVTLIPTGIATELIFGSPSHVNVRSMFPGSIASQEAHGSPVILQLGPAITAQPSGVASLVAFGAPSVDTLLTATPSGVPSGAVVGVPVLALVVETNPVGIITGEVIGTPSVGFFLIAGPTGVPSAVTFGLPVVTTVVEVTPESINSVEVFGTTVLLTQLIVSPDGIVSLEAVGTPGINLPTEFIGWGIPIGLEFT